MMTLAIVSTCVLVWLLQPPWAFSTASPDFLSLLTSQVYHKDFEHLAANMIVLGSMGYDFEKRYRTSWGLLLFCLVTGTLALSIEWALSDDHTALFGASGSCAALCGVYMRDRVRLLIVSPIVLPLLWSAFVTSTSGVAHGAHVSGLFTGILFSLALSSLLGRTENA